MTSTDTTSLSERHSHVFLGEAHAQSERRTWAVIALCGAMMIAEIVGGLLFGSIALVADGLHMSTHAGALSLAALAYSYSRRHANDARFTFGTGKLGDLAGFTSAIILAMIALLIGYEAVSRFLHPVAIDFAEAIPIACLGLAVNVASAWLLGHGDHDHGHGHSHGHAHGHSHSHDTEDERHTIETRNGAVTLAIHETDAPPRFRLQAMVGTTLRAADCQVETERPDGTHQIFAFADHGDDFESIATIPEPHAFIAHLHIHGEDHAVAFEEHDHGHQDGHGSDAAHRDNNMRAAIIHVLADATVSVLVILGLVLAREFGWLFMDPLAGIIGAFVIASWSYGLVRDTGAILLDMNPDRRMTGDIRRSVETEEDRLTDLHLWRLGPGHIGAIIAVTTRSGRAAEDYKKKLARFGALSHVTVEVTHAPQ